MTPQERQDVGRQPWKLETTLAKIDTDLPHFDAYVGGTLGLRRNFFEHASAYRQPILDRRAAAMNALTLAKVLLNGNYDATYERALLAKCQHLVTAEVGLTW
jgi:hypothetical protein